MDDVNTKITIDMVLDKLSEVTTAVGHNSGAIVAGGCPRDLYHCKLVKDIDIFVSMRAPKSGELLDFLRSKVASSEVFDLTFNAGYMDMDSKIVKVFEYGLVQYIFVDVSVDKLLETVLDGFDIGLCKIAFIKSEYGYYQQYLHNNFIEDYMGRKLTVMGFKLDQRQFAHTMNNHLPRVVAKYPDYEVVIREF